MLPFVCRKWHLLPIIQLTAGPFPHLIKVIMKTLYLIIVSFWILTHWLVIKCPLRVVLLLSSCINNSWFFKKGLFQLLLILISNLLIVLFHKVKLTCLNPFAVITTETKNILLRHMYQNDEEKVSISITWAFYVPFSPLHTTADIHWEREAFF